MRRFMVATFLMVALGGAGCGTTNIVASDPTARIFADNQMVGRGRGEITQRGTPGSMTVMVKTDDGRQEQTTIKRKITGITLFGALFTYGACLVFCWEYPDTVFVTLPPPGSPPYGGSWTGSWTPTGGHGAPLSVAADPWLQPPAGYQPQ